MFRWLLYSLTGSSHEKTLVYLQGRGPFFHPFRFSVALNSYIPKKQSNAIVISDRAGRALRGDLEKLTAEKRRFISQNLKNRIQNLLITKTELLFFVAARKAAKETARQVDNSHDLPQCGVLFSMSLLVKEKRYQKRNTNGLLFEKASKSRRTV